VLIKEVSQENLNACVKRITNACVNWKGDGLVSPSMALGSDLKLYADQNLQDNINTAEDIMYANKMRNGKPTRMRILGSLESRLHKMKENAVGDRSKRMTMWCEWFLKNVDFKCDCDILRLLCRYHDVGLLAYPDEIQIISADPRLEKIATPMQHMATGYRIAKCTAEIAQVAEHILSHHEWWDGMGYPNQQQGEEIPAASRIVSVLDSMEGMLSLGEKRHGALLSETLEALEDCSGRQFDPYLIEKIVPLIRSKPPKFLTCLES
jgi:response regulator RpfG family c-di-GMP phosphodiesterase